MELPSQCRSYGAALDKGIVLKKQLLQKAASMNIHLPAYQEVTWGGEKTDYEAEGARESVLRHENPDIRSLKELTMLGLKGISTNKPCASFWQMDY